MKTRKILSLIVVLAIFVNLAAFAVYAEEREIQPGIGNFLLDTRVYEGNFTDIGETGWITDLVAAAYELNLMDGVSASSFNPNGLISYAQAITAAAKLHAIYHTGSAAAAGNDFPNGFIAYAEQHGIISKGEYNGRLNNNITRRNVIKIWLGVLPEDEFDFGRNRFMSQKDVARDDSEIIAFYQAGIITGTGDGSFGADGFFTRAQLAGLMIKIADPARRDEGRVYRCGGIPDFIPPARYLNLPDSLGTGYYFAVGNTVIETDIFRLEMAGGILYDMDIVSKLTTLMELVEETTGMSFYPEGSRWENEKLIIAFGDYPGVAYGFGIYMSRIQTLIDLHAGMILHELLHVIESRNIPLVSSMFSEGFAEHTAEYIHSKVKKDDFDRPFMWAQRIEAETEKEIFSGRFEEYFSQIEYIFDDFGAQVTHMGGMFFGFYLDEKYGENKYNRLFKGFFAEYSAGRFNTNELTRYIKQETSEGVFIDFVDWYWENKTAIYDRPMEGPLLRGDYYRVRPCVHFIPGYYSMTESFRITAAPGGVFIDITDARAYARHIGVEFSLMFLDENGMPVGLKKTSSILAFYNDKGERIAVEDGQEDQFGRFHNQDITGVYIFGENATVMFSMNYESDG
jgi:hypothetical protein